MLPRAAAGVRAVGVAARSVDFVGRYPTWSIALTLIWQWTPFMMLIMLAGLQSLPSVVWVPYATLFLAIGGQVENAVYFVVIMGAFPSIAMGVMSAYDHIPPLTFSLARSMGARGPQFYRHFVFSASLPGYVAGMKQGWAFSWRSLMAAELIIGSSANL